MHPEMASALVQERQRELAREASRHNAARRAREHGSDIACTGTGQAGRRRIPRYRVSWSRVSLPAIGMGGRERSWVIVISATKGL